MNSVKYLAAVLIALGLSVPAAAQSQISTTALPTGNPRVDARMHFGALYFTPTFTMKEVGVDTNVFNSATDPRQDLTATFSPHVDAWLPLKHRALISTGVTADMVYFKSFASERSIDPDVTVRGDFYLNRMTLFIEDSFLSSRQRPSFEIDARSRRNENAALAGVNIRLTAKTSVDIAVNRSTFSYDQNADFFGTNLATALNHTSDGYGLKFRNKLTPKTTFELEAAAGKDRFEFSTEKNADRLRIVPALVFNPRALISGVLRIGFQRFRTLSENAPDETGLIASTDLSYSLFGDTQLGVRWARDMQTSFEKDQAFYASTQVGGRVRRRLIGRVDAIVSLDRYKYAYRAFLDIISSPRNDVTRTFTIDLGYRLGRDTRVGLALSHWSRSSSLLDRDYSGWRIGAGATYGR